MKVGLMGTPVSSGNRGVMALGTSLVSLCAEAGAGEIVMFLGHQAPEEVAFRMGSEIRRVKIVNYRLSPRAKPCEHLSWIVLASGLYRMLPLRQVRRWLSRHTPWIAALEEMDVVGDIRGGDSFSDIYGPRRFLLGFLAAWSVIMVKGALVQFPQTYGPYHRWWARQLAGWLLRRSPIIIARDRESQRVAQELVGPRRTVMLSPDVAFALPPRRPGRLLTEPPLPHEDESWVWPELRPIGLNVNGLMYNGGYNRANMFGLRLDYRAYLPRLVEALLKEHRGEVWLIPHTYAPPDSVESDPEACRRVRETLPQALRARVRIVTGEYDCQEIKAVIGLCEFFVGSRMHACIAALSQGIPTVGVAYSRKFEGVFDSVGVRDWVVDGRAVDTDRAVERVMELFRRRGEVRELLQVAADQARAELGRLFRKLVPAMAGRDRVAEGAVAAGTPHGPAS